MPIFEYRCRSCGEVSEIWEAVGTRNDSRECKHCGGREIERVLSPSHPAKNPRPRGSTCCGREERCGKPPCSSGAPAGESKRGARMEFYAGRDSIFD